MARFLKQKHRDFDETGDRALEFRILHCLSDNILDNDKQYY